ncbi:hypothetical protein KFJ24_02970 [Marinobacter sediminum]|uniref:hypothetical protein n=1 Tax=Marinobacter sediminum TaxID=256323 RepID=UPI00202DF3FB|nr:hypothetical protein [Marinobacter sediminum]MCM0611437.1 hypothetical protein [Marinobacter sediminum]
MAIFLVIAGDIIWHSLNARSPMQERGYTVAELVEAKTEILRLRAQMRQIDHIPSKVVFNPVVTNIGPLASVTYMEAMAIPERFEESTQYILRTTLFDGESGNSIWQMFSTTVDPKSLEQATREFSRVVVRELQKSFTE